MEAVTTVEQSEDVIEVYNRADVVEKVTKVTDLHRSKELEFVELLECVTHPPIGDGALIPNMSESESDDDDSPNASFETIQDDEEDAQVPMESEKTADVEEEEDQCALVHGQSSARKSSMEFHEYDDDITLAVLRSTDKRGQVLRDINKHKVDQMINSKKSKDFIKLFHRSSASQPTFFVKEGKRDRFVVIESNHRLCALSMRRLTDDEEDVVVSCRFIELPSQVFNYAWMRTTTLKYSNLFGTIAPTAGKIKIDRSLIPPDVFDRTLRTVADECIRAESSFTLNDQILAYQPYFDKIFTERDVNEMREHVRVRNKEYQKLVDRDICAPLTTSKVQQESLTAYCLSDETKEEFYGALKDGFQWPTGQHTVNTIFAASRADDAKTAQFLRSYRTSKKPLAAAFAKKLALFAAPSKRKSDALQKERKDVTVEMVHKIEEVDELAVVVYVDQYYDQSYYDQLKSFETSLAQVHLLNALSLTEN